MKKIMTALLFFVLVMAACSNDSTDANNDVENTVNNDQTTTDTNEDNSNNNNNDTNDESDETNAEDVPENTDETDTEEEQSIEDNENNKEGNDVSKEDVLKNLSFKIFKAQKEEDYDYLQSILAESASLNRDENSFYFDDIEYPHDMEFVQEEEDHLEFRYTHEEDNGVMIVGYGVVDYDTESSYAIDFQFIQEDGEWKMLDMDKNA